MSFCNLNSTLVAKGTSLIEVSLVLLGADPYVNYRVPLCSQTDDERGSRGGDGGEESGRWEPRPGPRGAAGRGTRGAAVRASRRAIIEVRPQGRQPAASTGVNC